MIPIGASLRGVAIVFRTWIAIITGVGIGSGTDALLTRGVARAHTLIITDLAIGFGRVVTDTGHRIACTCQVAIIRRFARINRAGQTHPFFAVIVDRAQVSILTQRSSRGRCHTALDDITEIIGAGVTVVTDFFRTDTRARLAPIQFSTGLTIIAREIFKVWRVRANTAITDILRAYVVVVGTIRCIAERRTANAGRTRVIRAFIAVIAIHR